MTAGWEHGVYCAPHGAWHIDAGDFSQPTEVAVCYLVGQLQMRLTFVFPFRFPFFQCIFVKTSRALCVKRTPHESFLGMKWRLLRTRTE